MTFLLRAVPYLAVPLLLAGLYFLGYTNGRHATQREFDAYVAKNESLVRELSARWDAEVARQGATAFRADENRNKTFAAIRDKIHASAPIAVPADVVGVLDAARTAANAAGSTGAPEEAVTANSPAPAPESAAVTAFHPAAAIQAASLWMVDVLEIHAECRDRVSQWEAFYAGLVAQKTRPAQ